MKEEWRPVVGYEGFYQVSNYGRVKSLDRTIRLKNGQTRPQKGGMKKLRKNRDGYRLVNLWKEGGQTNKRVHRLVLEAFVGPCPEGMEALHGDGNPENNRLDNLRWASSSENKLDTVRHGRHVNVNKIHCPRGHEYILENRVKSLWKKGWRDCLACARARAYVQRRPELSDQRQEIADRYYQAILKEATDAPAIIRSRDARTIMDLKRAEQRNEQQ